MEFSFRITTPNVTTTDEISVNFMNLLKLYHLGEIKLNQVLLSSVVPSVNHNITKMINRYFKKDVIILKVSDIKNIKINYDKLRKYRDRSTS